MLLNLTSTLVNTSKEDARNVNTSANDAKDMNSFIVSQGTCDVCLAFL